MECKRRWARGAGGQWQARLEAKWRRTTVSCFLLISFLLKWLTCLLTALSAFGIAQGGKGKSCKLSKLTAGAVCAWQFVAGKSCKLAYCGCCVRLAPLRCCQAGRPDTSGSAPAHVGHSLVHTAHSGAPWPAGRPACSRPRLTHRLAALLTAARRTPALHAAAACRRRRLHRAARDLGTRVWVHT